MNDIKIVHYERKYAASLAEMWNNSGENWGGESVIRTEDSIHEEQEKYGNIRNFLALDGEEVVGYCGYSNYKQDEGASYIPLLNVRPDYLGKKIGKKLVLKCVEEAIKSEWPRLDLYTWQGNDKAVPLYKKCGFFWEKCDDYTHLMNFLPYVMDTEAVKEFFEVIDWYRDNKREIIVESDGNTEGDFEFYEYNWMKNDLALNMEFERRGRGLTCIETNDYLIKTRLEKQDLIVGTNYNITYELVNKSGNPLEIVIKGLDNKNIKYSYNYNDNIVGKKSVTGRFYLDTITEKQDKAKTHPCVTSLITINGKDALFKIGVNPNYPVKIEVANEDEVKDLDVESICYINIENNFEKDVNIEFTLADDDCVSFLSPKIVLDLKAKQKKSLAVPCIVKSFGFYDEDILINIKTKDEQIKHSSKIRTALRGYQGNFHGETEENYNIYNGIYKVEFSKAANFTSFSKIGMNESDFLDSSIPQLGKPYYAEFKNKKPISVNLITKQNSELLKASFKSEKFPEIIMHYFIELFQDGILNTYCEIENISDNDKYDNLFVCQDSYYFLINAHIPYNEGVVKSNNNEGIAVQNWDAKNISENWLFSNYYNNTGIGWYPSMNVSFRGIAIVIESELGAINPGESVKTKPITHTIDTFNSWKQFRRYMGNNKALKTLHVKQSFESSINNNNPFVADKVELTFYENQLVPVEGKAKVETLYDSLEPSDVELEFTKNKAVLNNAVINRPEIDIVTMDIHLNTKKITRKRAVFFKSDSEVINSKYIEEGKNIFEVSNSIISLKASPDFSAGIYSMIYKGTEWLSSSFPSPSIKGWWNFWTGGICIIPGRFSFASIYKAEKSAEFIDVVDNHGNKWSGIKTTMSINEHEKYKGIEIEEYHLLISGAPVVCNFAVVNQNSGKYMQGLGIVQRSFIQEGKLEDNWVLRYEDGDEVIHECGAIEFESNAKRFYVNGSKNQNYTVTRLLHSNGWHEAQNTNNTSYGIDFAHIDVNDGERFITSPQFMIFSKEKLNDNILNDLKATNFEIK